MALFRGKGLEEEDMLHFFRDASQCDKMVDQGLPTSHLCVPLCDVTRLQLRLEAIDGGGRAIALQAGTGKGARETVIVLEEQKDVGLWIKNIKVGDLHARPPPTGYLFLFYLQTLPTAWALHSPRMNAYIFRVR